MVTVLRVGAGGFVGAALRYVVGSGVYNLSGQSSFPYGTLAVNIAGCFLIGLLAGFAETRHLLGEGTRAFIIIGLLGGFTTFSAFGYETVALVRDGLLAAAVANVGLQVVLGLFAVWIGLRVSQWA